jgi:AraC-like DNA-binding protein
MVRTDDGRFWGSTDRPGERLSVVKPQPDIEIVSVAGSHRHWCEAHEDFTVALVHREQGELVAEWRTRCRSLSTERGGLMLIEPGDVHVTKRVRARVGVADFDVIRFSPSLVARAARELGYRGDFHFRTPSAQDPRVFEALDRLVGTVARGESALAVAGASTEALTALITRLGEQPKPHGVSLAAERDYRLRRVNDYLASHLERRPTLTELEQVSGLSQWRLCARFNQSYGTSIGKCWNALRLRRAQRELERGQSLSMIVAKLGYRDEAYLCRVFKAHYGITPGAWRAMFRSNDRTTRRGRPQADAASIRAPRR